jgi:CheY-like chemotaxis protein
LKNASESSIPFTEWIEFMRILVLDDQLGLAEMLALSLRAAGYPAWGYTRASEALAALHDYDIIISDYHMPEMTGLEVARRAYAAGWRGSFLLMSGRAANIEEPLDHPLLRLILNKPFPTRELTDFIPKLAPELRS